MEFHGAILLLVLLSNGGLQWIERHIGADNGCQPYYPTVILEPRYLDGVIAGIPRNGLVARSARATPTRVTCSAYVPAAISAKANFPSAEVLALYSGLPDVVRKTMVASATVCPDASRHTPRHDAAGAH
jgi:hypothetical protein